MCDKDPLLLEYKRVVKKHLEDIQKRLDLELGFRELSTLEYYLKTIKNALDWW